MNALPLVLANFRIQLFRIDLRGLLVNSLIEVFLELLKVILAIEKHETALKGLSCEIRIWILIQSMK